MWIGMGLNMASKLKEYNYLMLLYKSEQRSMLILIGAYW